MVNVMVAYEDLMQLQKDAADKAAIISLLKTEFPDDTCQLIAIKSVLGIVEDEEENNDPVDPSDPDTGDDDTDPTDPVDPTP